MNNNMQMENNYTVGVGITTRNRPDVLAICLTQIARYYKPFMKVVVVDDNSSPEKRELNESLCNSFHMTVLYIYNDTNKGIAKSKNVCLKYLIDIDYTFLFDDDTMPKRKKWWKPFVDAAISSGQNHLLYLKDGGLNGLFVKQGHKDGVDIYNTGSGCLLFFTKKVLEVAGGFNCDYGIYGHEHNGHSTRLFNMGLNTLGKYLSIPEASEYILSFDIDGIPPRFHDRVKNFRSVNTQQEKDASLQSKESHMAYLKDNEELYFQPLD
jgi:glycosyltransferase involved in cell wall biosynthesis